MKRDEMNTLVQQDLQHIPKWTADGRKQGSLRTVYTLCRRHDLSRNPKSRPGDTLQAALKVLHIPPPCPEPEYDIAYFKKV